MKKSNPMLEIDVALEREHYRRGTDPLCRGVVTFNTVPGANLLRLNAPVHLCLVLDISGSMDVPDKYPMLLEAIELVCQSLRERQTLSLIVFSDEAARVVSGLDSRAAARSAGEIIDRINGTWFRFGQTSLAPGLKLALEVISSSQAARPDAVQRLYVLTDGQLDDPLECLRFTDYLREAGVEFTSYGFGDDFALHTMRSIIGSCAGGGVKRIPNGPTLKETFRHVVQQGSRVVARSAEVKLLFDEGVIPGDLFLHRPVPRWFPREDDRPEASIALGPLEVDRAYAVVFEARVDRPVEQLRRLGRVEIAYERDGQTVVEQRPLGVASGPEDGVASPAVRQVLDDVTALRDQDPDSLLRAYRARVAIYRREYRDRKSIETLERAVDVLERTGSLEELTEPERHEVESDQNTVTFVDLSDEDGVGIPVPDDEDLKN